MAKHIAYISELPLISDTDLLQGANEIIHFSNCCLTGRIYDSMKYIHQNCQATDGHLVKFSNWWHRHSWAPQSLPLLSPSSVFP